MVEGKLCLKQLSLSLEQEILKVILSCKVVVKAFLTGSPLLCCRRVCLVSQPPGDSGAWVLLHWFYWICLDLGYTSYSAATSSLLKLLTNLKMDKIHMHVDNKEDLPAMVMFGNVNYVLMTNLY